MFAPKNARQSPVCKPVFPKQTKIHKIVFHHVRKAGGTTIDGYLSKVAGKYGLQYEHVEGRNFGNNDSPATFYVTNMREPVQRTISSYKFEDRWPCEKLVHDKTFLPSLDNQSKNLDEFVDRDVEISKSNRTQPGLWHCASNCHVRWLSGDYYTVSEHSASKAREKLYQYNLIIDADRLADSRYVRRIERLFDCTGMVQKQMTCGLESKRANEKVPLDISEENRANIAAANELDIPLYKEMTACKYGLHFPAFDRSLFQQ